MLSWLGHASALACQKSGDRDEDLPRTAWQRGEGLALTQVAKREAEVSRNLSRSRNGKT